MGIVAIKKGKAMNERLTRNCEYERYVCNHCGDLEESRLETKKLVIDDMNLDTKYPHVEVLVRKRIRSIDVDPEKNTGTSEWLYLIEIFDIITWIRAEVDDLTGKVLDIEDTNLVKYPRF